MDNFARSAAEDSAPVKRTLQPIVTGASVLGITYKDGVMLCCDTLASYGKMSRFKEVPRYTILGDNTVFCCSGEYSDYQYLTQYLESVSLKDWVEKDGCSLDPAEYSSLICRVLYQRRSKLNPLWNSIAVAGHKDGKPYLGYVDLYGTSYQDQYIATGFGRYFAMTLLREEHRPDMSELEAVQLLEKCMTVLFYRDCQASNRIQMAKATANGLNIGEPYTIDSNWELQGWTLPTSEMSVAGCSW